MKSDGYIAVALATSPQGVQGELRCQLLTDFPERFNYTKRMFAGDEYREVLVERARLHRGGVVLKLAGVNDRDAAALMVGSLFYVPETEAVRLPPGTFFWHQIIGLRVQTQDGQDIGHVVEILATGSNDVYIVDAGGREILIPATKEVVLSIDTQQGIMIVEIMEGLL
ncbi:MAG: 16S rRNA processing protein RimM [Chloroflexi bacterium]|nr:16S rRNA processing protein RimM [Chloroflexota bacterium]